MRPFRRVRRLVEKVKAGWRHWLTFRKIDAGHRYQSRYHLHQRRTRRGLVPRYWRPLSVFCGPLLIAAGFVFIPTPGPSYIIIAVGLWLLAGEFLTLARIFDRVGVRLAVVGGWIKGLWKTSPLAGRALFVTALVALLAYGIRNVFAG